MKRLELSLLFGFAVMLLYFFLAPTQADAWWTSAFEPLCEALVRDDLCPRIICESAGTMAEDALAMQMTYLAARG